MRKKPLLLLCLLLFVVLFVRSSLKKTNIISQAQVAPTITKKVYVLSFNPIFSNGQTLSDYYHYTSTQQLVSNAVSFFREMSNGVMNYSIVTINEVNAFPARQDGFVFTEQSYKDCLKDETNAIACHKSTTADYEAILNNTTYDLCGKLNRGEIDELWILDSSWFQFYESALAGPGGFPYNGGTYSQNQCAKLMPIMTFNHSRAEEAAHDMGHRLEASMAEVYGTWSENSVRTNWDKFALVAAQSPSYSYSGCGDTHYPPNGTTDYDYANTSVISTYCDDFTNYPNLSSNPASVVKNVSCDTWGCTESGYLMWWFKHVPDKPGVGPDGKLNNWFVYLMDPNIAKAAHTTPTNGSFNNLSSSLTSSLASFTFSYSGNSAKYIINLSTTSDMSTDVYLNFAVGSVIPVTQSSPTMWDKYVCGKTLYWRVTSESGDTSPIQTALVDCTNLTPTMLPLSPTSVTGFPPTITPLSGSISLPITLLLHGIGNAGDNVNATSSGNQNPLHKQRQVSLAIYNANNDLVGTREGIVTYDAGPGVFRGIVNTNVPAGVYSMKVTIPQFLTRIIPGIITLNSSQSVQLLPISLSTGDTNSDNKLNILDYNMILDCFADLGAPRSCADANKKLMTDLTDDGAVNQFDYNLFLRELSVQSGQ